MNRGATTILVVDDDASLLDVVQVVLEGEGYGVLKALTARRRCGSPKPIRARSLSCWRMSSCAV